MGSLSTPRIRTSTGIATSKQNSWSTQPTQNPITSFGPTCSINRYYDPSTDSFISVDPDVQSTYQPYVFVNDDPLNGTDPLGLSGQEILNEAGQAPCQGACPSMFTQIADHWRGITKVVNTVATVAAAVACGASVACGATLGAVLAGSYYAEGHAGTKSFSLAALAEITGFGLATGGVGAYGSGLVESGQAEIDQLTGQSFLAKALHPLQTTGAYLTNIGKVLIGMALKYGAPTVGLEQYLNDRR